MYFLTHQETFDEIFEILFDNKGETSYARELKSEQWIDEALKMMDFMSATDQNLSKLQQVLGRIDWTDAEPMEKINRLMHHMGKLNIVGHCAPYSNISDPILNQVFSAALHHSYADDVSRLWSIHPWTPTVGVARDFMAHLVYNRFPAGDDFHDTFKIFLQRCDANTIIGVFEQYGEDFTSPEDDNWEPSFVSSEIDQWSGQWSLEQQQRLQSLVSPRVYFPHLVARVQKAVLEQHLQDNEHDSTPIRHTTRRM